MDVIFETRWQIAIGVSRGHHVGAIVWAVYLLCFTIYIAPKGVMRPG